MATLEPVRHSSTPDEQEQDQQGTPSPGDPPSSEPGPVNWFGLVRNSDEKTILRKFSEEILKLVPADSESCWIAMIDSASGSEGVGIDAYKANRVFSALARLNPNKDKNVNLLLVNRGGHIEPAYQISKLCKQYSKNRFLVVVPRYAKSAATLVAIGGDEIHIGPLGELGPIDPQLGGLPALGVSQALRTIAAVSQQYPNSAEMFARYLRMALTVEQIGYCERISESAVQYAERLLSAKKNLSSSAAGIAQQLVYEYKDHSFVIDVDEAREKFGKAWVKTETPELAACEKIFTLYESVDLLLRFMKVKRLTVSGDLTQDVMAWDLPNT